ncbi:MAG: phosphatase PAP2 family protein [Clostridia bacterium]|nr:phosphatase PAP2 family protein [Clostridia bacterium]
MEWEVRLIEWVQHNLGVLGLTVGKIFSFLGGETGMLLAVLIVLFCWKKELGMRLALVVAAVNAWLPMIKVVVLRPRPYIDYPSRVKTHELSDPGAAPQNIAAQGYSFPSSHAASASVIYPSLARNTKKKWLWFVAIAIVLLVGFSRIAEGMHYPTDILAGWILGFVGIGVMALLEKFVKREWIRSALLLATALPGVFFVRTQDYFTSLGLLVGVIAAIPFERKYIRFEDTKNVWAMILRTVLAFAIYFILNKLMKLPFRSEFLDSGSFAALLIRAIRYALIIFVIFGIYPKAFPLYEKIGKKKAK